uniref:Uncharacterized protein n=1 Tax=Plectus sambesii TaxID=2011161 RepID=A0A914VTG0_9BILA
MGRWQSVRELSFSEKQPVAVGDVARPSSPRSIGACLSSCRLIVERTSLREESATSSRDVGDVRFDRLLLTLTPRAAFRATSAIGKCLPMAGDRSLLIFFLLVSCYVVTWSSNVNLCHENPCQNDGTCYRVSDHPVSQLCDANFTNYNGRCYQLVLNNPLPWANAQIACNDMGAELAAVRNAEERKFIAAYIAQIMAKQNGAMRELNIWTAGHGFADVDGPAWVWMPLKDLMTFEKYWDPGQPNIHPNYSDACVAITERALYTTWISQSCSSIHNFFLCEKKDQTAVIADGKYAYQCQCQNGYRGVNCEMPPLSTATGERCSIVYIIMPVLSVPAISKTSSNMLRMSRQARRADTG